MNTKKIFAQANSDGIIHIAFVGTEEELQAQIDKDYADAISKMKESYEKYKAEFESVKDVDLTHLNAENIEEAAKHVYYKKMMLKTIRDLETFKKPEVKDGTYFVLDHVGKWPELEEK